jgi:hypothetical protein
MQTKVKWFLHKCILYVIASRQEKLSSEHLKYYLDEMSNPYAGGKFLLILDPWVGQTNPRFFNDNFDYEKGQRTCQLDITPPPGTLFC